MIYINTKLYHKGDFKDDNVYYNCVFEKIEEEGGHLGDSLFVNCEFHHVDLYWCQAYRSKFINCTLNCCDLRGNFDEAVFLECKFNNCIVGDNNLGGKTEWEDTSAINCTIIGDTLPIVTRKSAQQGDAPETTSPDR